MIKECNTTADWKPCLKQTKMKRKKRTDLLKNQKQLLETKHTISKAQVIRTEEWDVTTKDTQQSLIKKRCQRLLRSSDPRLPAKASGMQVQAYKVCWKGNKERKGKWSSNRKRWAMQTGVGLWERLPKFTSLETFCEEDRQVRICTWLQVISWHLRNGHISTF